MILRTRTVLWMSLCLLILCSCSPEIRRTMDDLSRLYESVASRYHPETGQVSLRNGHTLVLTLVNVPGRDVFKAGNKEWARGVAQFAYAAYPDRKNIADVAVVITRQHAVLVFSYAQTESFDFKADELSAPPAPK